MLKVINLSVVVPAGETKSNVWSLDTLIEGRLPVIKEVVCMNDLSSLRNKFFLSLKKDNAEFSNLEEVDLFGLSSAFVEKVSLDAPGGKYTYTAKSLHNAETTLYMQISLEY